jgi:tetratricopeptide (TPR) repeat protein
MSIAPLPIVIARRAADHDPLTRTAKAQRNIRLADRSLAEHGPSADMHNCLAEALQALGDPLRAAHQYQRAIRLATPGAREQLEAYYGLLTCLDGAGPDREAQLSLCMEALDRFPLDAQLLVALGGYLQALDQPTLAIRAYDVAFRHGQIEPRIAHLPNVPEIAAVCAATLMQLGGDDDSALTLLDAAVRTHPQSLRVGREQVELLVKLGRRDEALAAARSLPIEDRAREAWAVAVRGACAAGQAQWVTARAHLQLAYEAGCRERFCLRWLVVSHLGLGEASEAAAVLNAWAEFDPANPELAELAKAVAEQQAPSGDAHRDTSTNDKAVIRFDRSAQVQSPSHVAPASVEANKPLSR